jgi:hypothetical protein
VLIELISILIKSAVTLMSALETQSPYALKKPLISSQEKIVISSGAELKLAFKFA